MRIALSLIAVVLFGITAAHAKPAKAKSKQIEFAGGHPVPGQAGGGFCNIAFPHVHVYRPDHADVLYRVVDDRYVFIGDPVAFGYDGPTTAYQGPHPIRVEHEETVYCYLDGPHYHAFAPAPELKFVMHGDAYWYVGPWAPKYQSEGPRFRAINTLYKSIVYVRPIVLAEPPIGYVVPVIKVVAPPPPPPTTTIIVHVPWFELEGYDYDIYYYPRVHGRHMEWR